MKNIKESWFGLLINLHTDIKIKITKLPVTLLNHSSMKPLGIWDGPQDKILITQIVKLSLLTKPQNNSIKLWLIVLKMLDHILLIKLNKFSPEV